MQAHLCYALMRHVKKLVVGLVVFSVVFTLVTFCCSDTRPSGHVIHTPVVLRMSLLFQHTPPPAARKYVVYVCDGTSLCGGWADRQKGILSAFVLAQAMGRLFRIKLTKPCALEDHLEPKSIDWRIKPGELNGLSKTNIRILDFAAHKLRKLMTKMDLEAKYPQDIIYFTSNMEYTQYILQNDKYKERTQWMKKYNVRELYVTLLNEMFQFTPDLENKYVNFTSAIPRDKGSKLLCAQVRMGKNPTNPNDSQAISTVKSVEAVWTFIKGMGDMKKDKVFVTSDSEEIRQMAKTLFPSNIMDTTGRVLHVERYFKPEGVCGGVAKVLLDQRILSTCDSLIISRSGFGMIASWMRGKIDQLYCFYKDQVKSCHPDKLGFLISSW